MSNPIQQFWDYFEQQAAKAAARARLTGCDFFAAMLIALLVALAFGAAAAGEAYDYLTND